MTEWENTLYPLRSKISILKLRWNGSRGNALFWSFTDLDPGVCRLFIHLFTRPFISLVHSQKPLSSACCFLCLAPITSLKGDPFRRLLRRPVRWLIFLSAIWMHEIGWLLERALEIDSSFLLFPLLRVCREPPANQGPGEMPPARPSIPFRKFTMFTRDGAATTLACLSSCLFLPFGFSFFCNAGARWLTSLLFRWWARRFDVSYENQHETENSEADERLFTTSGIWVIWLFFLLDSREHNFLVKRKSRLCLRCCVMSRVNFVPVYIPIPLSKICLCCHI